MPGAQKHLTYSDTLFLVAKLKITHSRTRVKLIEFTDVKKSSHGFEKKFPMLPLLLFCVFFSEFLHTSFQIYRLEILSNIAFRDFHGLKT